MHVPRCMKPRTMQSGGTTDLQHRNSSRGRWKLAGESVPYSKSLGWRHTFSELIGFMLLIKGLVLTLQETFFEALLPKLPGSNRDARCHALNEKIQLYYERRGTEDRLKNFRLASFQRPSGTQPAKLKGSAAQVRALIPFVKELAEDLGDDAVPEEAAMKIAAIHLAHCYQTLAKSSEACRDEALYSSSQAFVNQVYALYLAGDGVRFRCKPKTHLFLELCGQPGVVPNSCWCYRDEDFGGPIARQSKMRGRWKNLTAYAAHAFDMFFMKNSVPRIVAVTS